MAIITTMMKIWYICYYCVLWRAMLLSLENLLENSLDTEKLKSPVGGRLGSGGRAGCLLSRGSVVWSPARPGSMSECPSGKIVNLTLPLMVSQTVYGCMCGCDVWKWEERWSIVKWSVGLEKLKLSKHTKNIVEWSWTLMNHVEVIWWV